MQSVVLVYQEAAERSVSPAVERRFEMVVAILARLSTYVDSIPFVQVQDDGRRCRVPNRNLLILHCREKAFDPQWNDVFGILAQGDRRLRGKNESRRQDERISYDVIRRYADG